MKETRNILVFGGSFNPPTLAHVEVLDAAMKELKVDPNDTYVVPASGRYINSWKSDITDISMSEADRYTMCVYAFDNLGVKISAYELDNISYSTYDTLESIQERNDRFYPNKTVNVHFLIGDDQLLNLSKWNNAAKMLSKFTFVCISRNLDGKNAIKQIIENDVFLSTYKDNIKIIALNTNNSISSTQARDLILNNGNLKGVLSESVIDFIKNKIRKQARI